MPQVSTLLPSGKRPGSLTIEERQSPVSRLRMEARKFRHGASQVESPERSAGEIVAHGHRRTPEGEAHGTVQLAKRVHGTIRDVRMSNSARELQI